MEWPFPPEPEVVDEAASEPQFGVGTSDEARPVIRLSGSGEFRRRPSETLL